MMIYTQIHNLRIDQRSPLTKEARNGGVYRHCTAKIEINI